MEIDLLRFLRSGEFGPIQFGITRQDLLNALGTPEDWVAEHEIMSSPILKYGSIEFYFSADGSGLTMIYTDWLSPIRGWGNLELSGWVFKSPPSLEEVKAQLKQEHIDYTQAQQEFTAKTQLNLASGVTLEFESTEDKKEEFLSAFFLRAVLS